MTTTIVTTIIAAPLSIVFDAISNAENFETSVEHIIKVEFLGEQRSGTGTRFRETRHMSGKEMTTELEMTQYVKDDHVRMVADNHGTVWDTLFAVTPHERGTKLTLTMEARAHKLLPRLINPLIKNMVRKEIVKDMEMVKDFCERQTG